MATPDLLSTSYAFSSGADATIHLCHGQSGEWKLNSITVVSSAAVSGGSNKFTLTVTENAGGDTVATAYASATTAVTAGTAFSLTMSEAGKSLEFGATDSVKIVYDETGSVTSNYQVVCAWQKARV